MVYGKFSGSGNWGLGCAVARSHNLHIRRYKVLVALYLRRIVKYRQKSECEYITVKVRATWDERIILNKRVTDMIDFDTMSKLCELKPGSSECDEAQKLKQKLADLNNYK